jgi:Glycosyl transferase family 11
MIIVKLIGGLGNQMFQYATAKSLALKHNTPLFIDTYYLLKKTDNTYTQRHLELNVFDINIQKALSSDIEKFKIFNSNKYTRTLQRKFPFLYNYLYIAESGAGFQKQFFNFGANTYLDGFWQSEKYFKDIKTEIYNDFVLKEPIPTNNHWLNLITQCNSVSLHVRRGDYISQSNIKSSHQLCDLTYYEQAIKHIKKTQSNIQLFIFSDDLAWCKSNIKFDEPIYFVEHNQNQEAHLDMILMSHCKHNIIANSSFSWWAAYLNKNYEKIIVAPKQWYTDKNINTNDLLPKEWIVI